MPRNIKTTCSVAITVIALLAASCAAKGDDNASETTEPGASPTTAASSSDTFGDLKSPCGKGDYTVQADEAAGSPDVLRIGVPNDRTSQIRPGLNKEIWDSSQAFVKWCNDQGGIGGIPIQIVDLDGKLLEVEAAMTKACNGVFMMVGGGYVQDNLEFSGKPDSDFHECGLAEIPAFAVSPEKAESNGQVQPIPHPASTIGTAWMQTYKKLEPDNSKSMAEVYGTLPAMVAIVNQTLAIIENQDVELAGKFDYPVTGLTDWTPLAQKIIGSKAESFHFVGEPTNLGNLVKTLRQQGWEGNPVVETNMYTQSYVDTAGAEGAVGTYIRSVFHPFEEADQWPATKQYLDILNKNVQDATVATLGEQSWSAWMLFGVAANACASSNDNVLNRECVLKAAADVDNWTSGGLHSAQDPGPHGGTPGECEMMLTVNDKGEFERSYPEIDSADDGGEGFACYKDSIIPVPANDGLAVIGPDQPI